MSLAHGLVRLAAALLPRDQRSIRYEEWSADLDHCGELGIRRRDVVLGALRTGLIDGLGWRTPLGRSRWLAVGSIAVVAAVVSVPVGAVAAFMTGQLRGVVTVESLPDGTTREVHWKEYPGKAEHGPGGYDEIDPEAVLAAPSAEAAWGQAQRLLAEIEQSLAAEFSLDWAPSARGGAWPLDSHPTSNGYGGQSLLVVLNSPGSRSTTVPDGWPAQQRAIEVIAEVAAGHGYEAPILDLDQPWFDADEASAHGGSDPDTAVLVPGVLEGPHGQWLWFAIEDSSKGEAGATDVGADWSPGISLMWGAMLLPSAAQDEFATRLSAFDGLPRPSPFISD